jgi:hypothetical protein
MVVSKTTEINGDADSNTWQRRAKKTQALILKNVYANVK